MSQKPSSLNYGLGFVGGAAGYFAFRFALSQGLYAMVLPGALLGIGCGLLSGTKSFVLGAICGVAGVVLGIFVEWQAFPFIDNHELGYFITHLPNVLPMHLLMIGLGGFGGLWFGMGRAGGVWKRKPASETAE